MTDEQALALVAEAQRGDPRAQRAVALHCYERFVPRVRRLAAKQADPAISLEDLESVFFEGCMAGTLIADHRGDPLYHVGQRGYWAAQSALRTARRITREQARVWAGMEDGRDPVSELPDPGAPDDFERAEDAIVARQRVEVLTTAPLKPRLRQAVDAILSGEAGDPRDDGFNKRLAACMRVSPQRASQVVAELRGILQ
jgi:hypothetical protein